MRDSGGISLEEGKKVKERERMELLFVLLVAECLLNITTFLKAERIGSFEVHKLGVNKSGGSALESLVRDESCAGWCVGEGVTRRDAFIRLTAPRPLSISWQHRGFHGTVPAH